MRTVGSKLATLCFRKADFDLFKDLLDRVLWDSGLEGRGAQESCMTFKGCLLQAQKQCIPTKMKSGKSTRGPAWINKKLLDNLKQVAYRGWKQGKIAWAEHREIVPTVKDLFRKAKARAEVNLAKGIIGNKKSSFRCISNKRKTTEKHGCCQEGYGRLSYPGHGEDWSIQ